MGDPDKPDPLDPSWSVLADPDSSDNVYFHQNILADFGWHGFEQSPINPPTAHVDNYKPSDPPAVATTIRNSEAGPSSSSIQSASSTSSEDQPERSLITPAEIPSKVMMNKKKKKGQKRVRQARFAFMTKSEVDHLEDGYRWRKYGQKAVKNSPFPRSYYRCTNTKCTVKKRVERSSEDPTVVITTYEGQHCHHTVGFQRSTGFITHEGSFLGQFPPPLIPGGQFFYPPSAMQFSPRNNSINVNNQQGCTITSFESPHQESPLVIPQSSQQPPPPPLPTPPTASPGEGLLGDIVPPGMRNP